MYLICDIDSVLILTDSHQDGYLWKRDYVTAYINGQPCAWIDDDFAPADHGWAFTRTATGHPTLLIQPSQTRTTACSNHT